MITQLNNHDLLKIEGIDAKKLLQGQVTCDVDKITATTGSLAAHCNPQGRIISLFYLFQFQDAYYLLLPAGMASIALSALKKYAIFYKVTLTNVSNTLNIIGCAEKEIAGLAADGNIAIANVPAQTPRYLILSQIKLLAAITSTSSEWKQQDIEDKVPAIYPETSGIFLPHELNLPELGAINFDKGCYTGQEIIARMHYRGKLKTHLYRATILHLTSLSPGTVIYSAGQQAPKASGTIVDAYKNGAGLTQALIVTDEINAKNGHLFLAPHSNSAQQTFFNLLT